MEHIDTVLAANLTKGDVIETWDEDKSTYVYETVISVQEDSTDEVIVFTEENPEEGWSFFWDQDMRLFRP